METCQACNDPSQPEMYGTATVTLAIGGCVLAVVALAVFAFVVFRRSVILKAEGHWGLIHAVATTAAALLLNCIDVVHFAGGPASAPCELLFVEWAAAPIVTVSTLRTALLLLDSLVVQKELTAWRPGMESRGSEVMERMMIRSRDDAVWLHTGVTLFAMAVLVVTAVVAVIDDGATKFFAGKVGCDVSHRAEIVRIAQLVLIAAPVTLVLWRLKNFGSHAIHGRREVVMSCLSAVFWLAVFACWRIATSLPLSPIAGVAVASHLITCSCEALTSSRLCHCRSPCWPCRRRRVAPDGDHDVVHPARTLRIHLKTIRRDEGKRVRFAQFMAAQQRGIELLFVDAVDELRRLGPRQKEDECVAIYHAFIGANMDHHRSLVLTQKLTSDLHRLFHAVPPPTDPANAMFHAERERALGEAQQHVCRSIEVNFLPQFLDLEMAAWTEDVERGEHGSDEGAHPRDSGRISNQSSLSKSSDALQRAVVPADAAMSPGSHGGPGATPARVGSLRERAPPPLYSMHGRHFRSPTTRNARSSGRSTGRSSARARSKSRTSLRSLTRQGSGSTASRSVSPRPPFTARSGTTLFIDDGRSVRSKSNTGIHSSPPEGFKFAVVRRHDAVLATTGLHSPGRRVALGTPLMTSAGEVVVVAASLDILGFDEDTRDSLAPPTAAVEHAWAAVGQRCGWVAVSDIEPFVGVSPVTRTAVASSTAVKSSVGAYTSQHSMTTPTSADDKRSYFDDRSDIGVHDFGGEEDLAEDVFWVRVLSDVITPGHDRLDVCKNDIVRVVWEHPRGEWIVGEARGCYGWVLASNVAVVTDEATPVPTSLNAVALARVRPQSAQGSAPAPSATDLDGDDDAELPYTAGSSTHTPTVVPSGIAPKEVQRLLEDEDDSDEVSPKSRREGLPPTRPMSKRSPVWVRVRSDWVGHEEGDVDLFKGELVLLFRRDRSKPGYLEGRPARSSEVGRFPASAVINAKSSDAGDADSEPNGFAQTRSRRRSDGLRPPERTGKATA